MRSETEIRELKGKLDKLTGFIADFGSQSENKKADMTYANDTSDALSWLLGEISTEHFEGDGYLGSANLQQVAEEISKRTGKKLQDYQLPTREEVEATARLLGLAMKCPECGAAMAYIERYDKKGYPPFADDINVLKCDGKSWWACKNPECRDGRQNK